MNNNLQLKASVSSGTIIGYGARLEQPLSFFSDSRTPTKSLLRRIKMIWAQLWRDSLRELSDNCATVSLHLLQHSRDRQREFMSIFRASEGCAVRAKGCTILGSKADRKGGHQQLSAACVPVKLH